jgi:hypothetical protein
MDLLERQMEGGVKLVRKTACDMYEEILQILLIRGLHLPYLILSRSLMNSLSFLLSCEVVA